MKIKCSLLLIMLVVSSLVAAQNAAPTFQIIRSLARLADAGGRTLRHNQNRKKRSSCECFENAGYGHER